MRCLRDARGGWGRWVLVAMAAALLVGGCGTPWRAELARKLPVLGHRNWIIVADSAYPHQNSDGIETVATRANQMEVVRAVLDAIDASPHVRPVIYLDSEMEYVKEADAAGIDAYRKQLDALMKARGLRPMRHPHETLLPMLKEGSKEYRVLVLKTDFAVPYTSVFVQLDCGYWGADQEQKLRARIGEAAKNAGNLTPDKKKP